MNVSKEFVDRVASKLTHHDLIVIENSLNNQFLSMYDQYRYLSDLVSMESSARKIQRLMKSLCQIYDRMIDIRTTLRCFDDIRMEDFKNKSYEISSDC